MNRQAAHRAVHPLRRDARPAAVFVHAFTLVEAVISIAILSVILLGMHSAMLLAARAAPDERSAPASAMRAAAALDSLASELAYAITIDSADLRSIQFTVADRTGDGAPDRIRYAWSGIAGEPLLRTVNGGAAAPVATDVAEFHFNYNRRAVPRDATFTESGEVLLSSNDGLGLLNLGDFAVDSSNWIGQYISPNLPGSAVYWRPTRILFKARKNGGSNGLTRIQARTANASNLPGVVLAEAQLFEADLIGTYTWRESRFTGAPLLPANSSVCVVFQWERDADACYIQFQALLGAAPNANRVTTTNAGSSWTAQGGQDLVYYFYGTYSSADPVVTDFRLTGVQCAIRCGADPNSRITTLIRVLNEPSVAAP